MSKYILICSAGHSGSTLLDLLLGSHSRLESLGEIAQLPKNIALNTTCMCGTAVSECRIWNEVAKVVLTTSGVDILSDPYAYPLGFINAKVVVDRAHQTPVYKLRRRASLGLQYAALRLDLGKMPGIGAVAQEMASNSVGLYDAVRKVCHVDGIIDSSKSYIRAAQVYLNSPEDTRLILLVRDGRGVFYSGLKAGFGKRESLQAWRRYYSRALPLFDRKVDPEKIIEVRYEDLARDAPAQLARICGFLGVEYESAMLNFHSSTHHIANGNNMRFRGSAIRLDTSWKDELGSQMLGYFENRCGELNRRLGFTD